MRQKLKAREWDELMSKKKFKVLQAAVTGCTWASEGLEAELLQPYAVCLLEPLPKEELSTPEGPSRELLDEQSECYRCSALFIPQSSPSL